MLEMYAVCRLQCSVIQDMGRWIMDKAGCDLDGRRMSEGHAMHARARLFCVLCGRLDGAPAIVDVTETCQQHTAHPHALNLKPEAF